jgi:hypothetical protein
VPEHTSTSAAAEVAELAADLGFTLDPEQRLALDALLAENGPRWATLEACIVCARQNLKTFLFKLIALYELFVVGSRLLVWSAHEFDTTMESFRDLREIIDGTDWMRRRVVLVRDEVGSQGNGRVGIELKNRQRIRFKARTSSAGRGLTGDVVFLDEAFALQANHVGSLLPTMAARSQTGNPRIYYGSSAGQLRSTILRRLRERGRAGNDPSLAYIEWCAPLGCETVDCTHAVDTKGCALDDIEKVRLANPALERRISIDFVEAMRRSLPVEEFAREFLGWWEDPVAGSSGIPIDAWEACAERDAEVPDPVVLGLDVAPNHASAAITAHSNGVTHLADHHAGTSWILGDVDNPGRLLEIDQEHEVLAVVIDPTGPVGGMIPDLERAGFTVRNQSNPTGKLVLLAGLEQTRACEQFLAGVLDTTFVHRDEYALNVAVAGAGRRIVGDSWKWSRRDSTVDISPLVAATVGSFFASKPPVTDVVLAGDLMA